MGHEVAIKDWCAKRTPGEWQRLWEAHYHSVDVAQQCWLAYRGFPEQFGSGETFTSWRLVADADWDTLVRTLELACDSSERRFLMNDVLWGSMLIFPPESPEAGPAGPEEAGWLAWLLGFGAGDHAFRGEMMWNLTSEDRIMPEEVGLCAGDMEEFMRRYPVQRDWLKDCDEVDRRGGIGREYDSLPEGMQCAVGALAYRDAWYGGSRWEYVIADHRRQMLAASRGKTRSLASGPRRDG